MTDNNTNPIDTTLSEIFEQKLTATESAIQNEVDTIRDNIIATANVAVFGDEIQVTLGPVLYPLHTVVSCSGVLMANFPDNKSQFNLLYKNNLPAQVALKKKVEKMLESLGFTRFDDVVESMAIYSIKVQR